MEQNNLLDSIPTTTMSGQLELVFRGKATEQHAMPLDLYAKALNGMHIAFLKSNKELLGVMVHTEILAEEEGSLKSVITWSVRGITAIAGVTSVALTFYANTIIPILEFHNITGDDIESFAYNTLGDIEDFACNALDDVENFACNTFLLPIKLKLESNGNEEQLNHSLNKLDNALKHKITRLYNNQEYRFALDDLTYFLESAGMDELELKNNNYSISVKKEHRPFFKAQLSDTTETETIDDIITVVSIGKAKTWRFYSEVMKKEYNTTIEDEEFLGQAQNLSVEEVFSQRYRAKTSITTITKAGSKSPRTPTYSTDNILQIIEDIQLTLEE